MNTNYKSNLATKWRQIISAVSLSAFLFVATAFAETPLRANGKIAFTSDRDGNREIYVMNPDGTNQTRLTNNSISDDHPTWSPDGRKIAFISQRPTGQYAVFQMNADGTGKTEITSVNYQPSPYYATGWTISWSPDARQLAFTDVQGNLGSINIVNADGSGRRMLTSGYGPAWAPDGSKILFITGSFPWALHTIRPDGSDLRTLPPLPNYYNWYYDVTWSPTGAEIAITAFDTANEIIFISNADGTNPREFYGLCAKFTLGCSRLAAPSWSPDGNTIVFLAWGFQSGMEIYVKDIAGGASRRLTNTTGNNSDPSWQPLPNSNIRSPFDFDGDAKTDLSIFRPAPREWWINRSLNGLTFALQFGAGTDTIAPADFTGDGKTDVAFFRPSTGQWFVLRSENFSFYAFPFGTSGDVPVPADYDADGKADAAVFRPSTLMWFIQKSGGATDIIGFGAAGDVPTVADYDGDGKADIAIYRPNAAGGAQWWVRRSSNGSVFATVFGTSTDRTVQGDYTGDGKADIAFWRPSNGNWFVLRSEDLSFYSFPFGTNGDIPVPGDYDGDGRNDAAVFRPSSSTWFAQRSTAGTLIQQFGIAGDIPLPSAFVP